MIKKVGLVLICILIIAGLFFGYQNRVVLAEKIDAVVYQSPCDTPIPYRIGTIDARFGLTEDGLAVYAQQSANIWNSAYGKTLFEYDPEAELTISLVYDERQSLSTQINDVDMQLEKKEEALKPEIAAYERRGVVFQKELAALNARIEQWNSQGGAPSDEYDKLIAEQKRLQQEGKELSAIARSLNRSTDQYNTQAKELHAVVDTFNETLQDKPEEGLYIADETGQRILIYFYTSDNQIVRTIAHEMGHALGLDHTKNAASMMYPKSIKSLALAPDDLSALTVVCRKRSIAELAQQRVAYITEMIQQQKIDVLLNDIRNGFN